MDISSFFEAKLPTDPIRNLRMTPRRIPARLALRPEMLKVISIMATSIPLDQIKVLLLENIHPSAEAYFRKQGFNVTRLTHALSEEELIEQASDVHLIGVRSKTQLTERYLTHAKRLWGIGCFCIGTNQVDLTCASRLGIPVFNSPFQNTRSVAELVISETIALHRKLFAKSQRMHQGQWEKSAVGAHEIRHLEQGR